MHSKIAYSEEPRLLRRLYLGYRTHIHTSMATNMRTAFIVVISGSHSALLAAKPISAQFVMAAITLSASNAT